MVIDRIGPAIWREVEVPVSITLEQLHQVIQALFGWQDCHLYLFNIDEEIDCEDSAIQASLTAMFYDSENPGWFTYLYDFGDRWSLTITVESLDDAHPGKEYPVFVAGARAGPPEDVGGWSGYYGFVKPQRHPERSERHVWDGRPYYPEKINARAIRTRLSRLRANWPEIPDDF
jgi:hypothetical protein